MRLFVRGSSDDAPRQASDVGGRTSTPGRNSVADAARFCVSLLGASMPHVPFLGARKTVFSTCVHGLRAYHALNQYRIRYEDMRCKFLVLAPLRLFGL